MNADVYVAHELYLASSLNTGVATLTLDSPSTFTIDHSEVWGNVRRINLATDAGYSFGPYTGLTFHNGTGLSEATVKIVPSAPPGHWLCALSRYYRISMPGWTAGTADLRLHYTPDDGACVPLKLYRAPAGTTDWTAVPGAVSLGASPDLYLSVNGLDAVSGYDFALGNLCQDSSVVTNANDSGAGSLRQAMVDTCANGVITFNDNYTTTLTSPLTLTKTLTIDGATQHITLSGNHAVRVFQVSEGVTLTLHHLTVADGAATEGGGIYSPGGKLIIANSTFSGHHATGDGGAISTYPNAAGAHGIVRITNSTFADNSADGSGGAIYASEGPYSGLTGFITVTNSTFAGNSASAGNGGGFYGGHYRIALRNTILANDAASGDCTFHLVQFSDGGGNLEDGATCNLSAPTSMPNTDPLLSALGDHGGSTPTIPLLVSSPAIDAGDATICADANGVNNLDQRGEPRTDLRCDSGAFEVKSADHTTEHRTVSSTTTTTFGAALVGILRDAGLTDPGVITVTRAAQTPGPGAIGVRWAITPTVTGGISLTLTLCYTDSESSSLSLANLRFWRRDGGAWSQVPGTPTTYRDSAGNNCATLAGIQVLSEWTLATSQPTAVRLRHFSAISDQRSAGDLQ
jgi:predicted outer membrane repeat protein